MKFKILNVGRVESADIDLCGITVLAGANGTGKSTISRSLMSISSVSRRINSLILAERGRSIIKILQESFRKNGGDVFYSESIFNGSVNKLLQGLDPEWWEDAAKVVAWLREHNRQEMVIFPNSFLEGDKCLHSVHDATPQIREVLVRSDDEYVMYICRKLFKKAFSGQLKPVFATHSDSVITVETEGVPKEHITVKFKDGEVDAHEEIGRTFYPSVVYFEPINYVDFVNSTEAPISDRYSAGGYCSCNVIKKEPPKNLSLEEQHELDEANEIIKDIISSIHGRLVDDDEADIKFNEKFANGSHLINVKNIASGMKTMAAIVRAVENRSVRRGSLLIIDEPESNLHPKWQVAFASFLAAFVQRLGVFVLLNTHSPYFMQAINVYSGRKGIPCKFYDMIIEGDVSRTEEITNQLDRVFRTMSEPFNDLIGQ